MSEITALFALPSTAGAVTWHPMVVRHSLNPAGKTSRLLPAVTSIVMIAPLSVSDMASARESTLTPALKEGTCRPALTHADHLWHAAVHHP